MTSRQARDTHHSAERTSHQIQSNAFQIRLNQIAWHSDRAGGQIRESQWAGDASAPRVPSGASWFRRTPCGFRRPPCGAALPTRETPPILLVRRDISILSPNNQRQPRTLHIQEDVLPDALCKQLCPVSAALASISRMDSISSSYCGCECLGFSGWSLGFAVGVLVF